MKQLGSIKIGDLVDIDPVFFGYDNIKPQWYNKLFVIVEVASSSKKTAKGEPYIICRALAPDNSLHDFYDYELRVIQ